MTTDRQDIWREFFHPIPGYTELQLLAEVVRLRRTLAKLREPSEAVLNVAAQFDMDFVEGLRAIVAAAEQEVKRAES